MKFQLISFVTLALLHGSVTAKPIPTDASNIAEDLGDSGNAIWPRNKANTAKDAWTPFDAGKPWWDRYKSKGAEPDIAYIRYGPGHTWSDNVAVGPEFQT